MTWLPGAPSRLRSPSWAAASRGWPRRTGWPSSTAWTSSCWRPTAGSGARSRPRPWPGCRSTPGPDAFLSRGPRPGRARLEAGPGRRRRARRRPGGAFIWSRGRLRRIPQGGAFGIPDRVLPLLRSRLLSPARRAPGRARPRAAAHHARRRPHRGGGAAAAPGRRGRRAHRPAAARRRARRLGRPAQRAQHRARRRRAGPVRPVARARAAPSQCRRRRSPPAPPAPPLVSLRGGLEQARGCRSSPRSVPTGSRTGAPVTALRRADGGWQPHDPHGVGRRAAGRAGGAGPRAAPSCWRPCDPGLAARAARHRVRRRRHRDPGAAAAPRSASCVGTGFLVPPVEGALLVGCTLAHQQVAAPRRRRDRHRAPAVHGRARR